MFQLVSIILCLLSIICHFLTCSQISVICARCGLIQGLQFFNVPQLIFGMSMIVCFLWIRDRFKCGVGFFMSFHIISLCFIDQCPIYCFGMDTQPNIYSKISLNPKSTNSSPPTLQLTSSNFPFSSNSIFPIFYSAFRHFPLTILSMLLAFYSAITASLYVHSNYSCLCLCWHQHWYFNFNFYFNLNFNLHFDPYLCWHQPFCLLFVSC